MKLIHKSRGGGKTTDLIEEARKLKGYNLIVCSDIRAAQIVWKIILENKYDLPQPISFNEFIKGEFCGKNINCFLIDNADLLIQYLSKGVKIHAITFKEVEDGN